MGNGEEVKCNVCQKQMIHGMEARVIRPFGAPYQIVCEPCFMWLWRIVVWEGWCLSLTDMFEKWGRENRLGYRPWDVGLI